MSAEASMLKVHTIEPFYCTVDLPNTIGMFLRFVLSSKYGPPSVKKSKTPIPATNWDKKIRIKGARLASSLSHVSPLPFPCRLHNVTLVLLNEPVEHKAAYNLVCKMNYQTLRCS